MCVPGKLLADGVTYDCFPDGNAPPGHSTSPDPNLDHPVVEDSVPFGSLAALTIFGYFFVFWANAAVLHTYDSLWTDNGKLKVVLIKGEVLLRSVLKAFAFSTLTVEIVKNWVGRPRPNYLNDVENQGFDAARSFPSGHSAFAVALLGLLSLYLMRTLLSVQSIFYYSKHAANQEAYDEAQVDAFEYDNEYEIEMKKVLNIYNGDAYMFLALFIWMRHCQMLSMMIAVAPFLAALYVCCSRIEDYKHHYSDVLGGAFVGAIYAVLSFVYYKGEFYYGFKYDMEKILTDLGDSDSSSDNVEIAVKSDGDDDVDVVVKEQEDMAIMMDENKAMKA